MPKKTTLYTPKKKALSATVYLIFHTADIYFWGCLMFVLFYCNDKNILSAHIKSM